MRFIKVIDGLFCGAQIVAWPEDRKCERSWLLDKVAGAVGAIVMLSDNVGFILTLSI